MVARTCCLNSQQSLMRNYDARVRKKNNMFEKKDWFHNGIVHTEAFWWMQGNLLNLKVPGCVVINSQVVTF